MPDTGNARRYLLALIGPWAGETDRQVEGQGMMQKMEWPILLFVRRVWEVCREDIVSSRLQRQQEFGQQEVHFRQV